MNEFIKTINKYVILLIVVSLFGKPWFQIRIWLYDLYPPGSFVDSIPSIVDYLIRITVIILLIIDFKEYKLKNVVISCISALFFPLLGIVILAIMYLEKEKANA
jgi:asparagine N-glycosylation enzyme membrane subunit Stt3